MTTLNYNPSSEELQKGLEAIRENSHVLNKGYKILFNNSLYTYYQLIDMARSETDLQYKNQIIASANKLAYGIAKKENLI